jgi:hypothetical protein
VRIISKERMNFRQGKCKKTKEDKMLRYTSRCEAIVSGTKIIKAIQRPRIASSYPLPPFWSLFDPSAIQIHARGFPTAHVERRGIQYPTRLATLCETYHAQRRSSCHKPGRYGNGVAGSAGIVPRYTGCVAGRRVSFAGGTVAGRNARGRTLSY